METKIQKELKSFKNKLHGSNKIWFDSLSNTKKFDVLFMWKYEKSNNKLTEPLIKRVRGKIIKIYPVKLKYFLNRVKSKPGFRVNKIRLRETIISNIIEQ